MMNDLISTSELLKQDFTLGDTTFKIDKLCGLDGWKLFDKIRAELGVNVDRLDFKDGDAMTAIVELTRLILSTSSEFINETRSDFYPGVRFRRAGDSQFQQITVHNEMSAYEKFDPIDFYELLTRCFMINFFSSFQKIKKIFKRRSEKATDTKQKKQN